jgi:hypothetical protein
LALEYSSISSWHGLGSSSPAVSTITQFALVRHIADMRSVGRLTSPTTLTRG